MGEILGLGITHYPGLTVQGNLCRRIKMCLADPALPERLRSIENWPEPMRRQWGADEGLAHSDAHRRDMIEGFRMARGALDEFRPDFCVIWGDDQFENYREDCVPPFSVLAYGEVAFQPAARPGSPSDSGRRRSVTKNNTSQCNDTSGCLLRPGFTPRSPECCRSIRDREQPRLET